MNPEKPSIIARLFTEQLPTGRDYSQVPQTIGISLVNFVLFEDTKDLQSTFHFYDEVHGKRLSDVLEIHFLELAKFRLARPEQLTTSFEKWLHILKYSELYQDREMVLPKGLRDEEGIGMAIEKMRNASDDPQVRELVEQRIKELCDVTTEVNAARREGREEAQLEIARSLLGLLDDQAIARSTGLSLEVIERLRVG